VDLAEDKLFEELHRDRPAAQPLFATKDELSDKHLHKEHSEE
jgi:hypothetical protein